MVLYEPLVIHLLNIKKKHTHKTNGIIKLILI